MLHGPQIYDLNISDIDVSVQSFSPDMRFKVPEIIHSSEPISSVLLMKLYAYTAIYRINKQ